MEVSGEVAARLVKEGLQVAEAALRLSGKGAVNAAALHRTGQGKLQGRRQSRS